MSFLTSSPEAIVPDSYSPHTAVAGGRILATCNQLSDSGLYAYICDGDGDDDDDDHLLYTAIT
jgi:hypothetical protein